MNKEEVEDRMRIDPEYRFMVGQSIREANDRENPERAKIEIGKCYEEIIEVLNYYMEMPDNQKKIAALWIIGTYFHKDFSTFPFFFINAMRGSGKTRLLNILAHLSKGSKGQVQTGITEAVLFRSPPSETLILDECESIGSKDKATLREYLNACYKKGGTVRRAKKNKEGGYDIDTFHPYKPIAMANIWGMEEVLGDRCVNITLEKSNNPIKTKKVENFDTNLKIEKIKRTLEQFSVACVMTLQKNNIYKWNDFIDNKYNTAQPTQPTLTTQATQEEEVEEVGLDMFFNKIDETGIDGRNLELLFPLILISRFLSDTIFEEILIIGKELMDLKKEDEFIESRDVSLYNFVSEFNEEREFHSIKELTNHFKLWLGESSDEWINESWFGKSLKRLNLVIDKKRLPSGRFVSLNVLKAKEKLKIFQKEEIKK